MNHLELAEKKARESSVFADVKSSQANDSTSLTCDALEAAAPAHYSLEEVEGRWFVGLHTKDRWLSESIEAELMHAGDSLEELVEEELVDLGLNVEEVSMQHYRDEQLQYVFRSPLPREVTPEEAALWLMAYEATFRELGDMSNSES